MKNGFKYLLLILSIGFLGFSSVYFEKLSEVNARAGLEFDFTTFADSLYYQGMIASDDPMELNELLSELEANPEGTFDQHGNRLGIGNSAYFMVKSSGQISEMDADAISLYTPDGRIVEVNTRYIFGNALRDASGLVELTDFKTNAEFNRVSEALNALVREEVIMPILDQLKIGDNIEVLGAIKLSKKNLKAPTLQITPSQIKPR